MLSDLHTLLWGRAQPAPRLVRTYARDQAWTSKYSPQGRQHEGYFRAAGQRWRGIVHETDERFDFWILRPPIGFIRGTWWEGCFHAIGRDGWWRITFRPGLEPRDLDSGLVAVNKILQLCFRLAAQRRR